MAKSAFSFPLSFPSTPPPSSSSSLSTLTRNPTTTTAALSHSRNIISNNPKKCLAKDPVVPARPPPRRVVPLPLPPSSSRPVLRRRTLRPRPLLLQLSRRTLLLLRLRKGLGCLGRWLPLLRMSFFFFLFSLSFSCRLVPPSYLPKERYLMFPPREDGLAIPIVPYRIDYTLGTRLVGTDVRPGDGGCPSLSAWGRGRSSGFFMLMSMDPRYLYLPTYLTYIGHTYPTSPYLT
jgi:hypothetical protein